MDSASQSTYDLYSPPVLFFLPSVISPHAHFPTGYELQMANGVLNLIFLLELAVKNPMLLLK